MAACILGRKVARPLAEILQRYVASRGEDVVGRYKPYVPEPDSENESGHEDVEPYDGGSIVMDT